MASTLCWDCKRAVERTCSWAHDLEPVQGWTADPCADDSYCVKECPEFVRDAYGFGTYRPEQYVEKLEKDVKRLKEKVKKLEAALIEKEKEAKRSRKQFGEPKTDPLYGTSQQRQFMEITHM